MSSDELGEEEIERFEQQFKPILSSDELGEEEIERFERPAVQATCKYWQKDNSVGSSSKCFWQYR